MKKLYFQYVDDILSGKIPSGNLIQLACKRFNRFLEREDIYLDENEIDRCILYISQMKHFLGKSAGKQFILEPWQQFVVANVLGLKYKATNKRVCNETNIMIARKNGKDALIGAICDYLLIADGEAAPEIVVAANSTDQAKICFKYISEFGKSLDPKGKILKYYRNYVTVPSNNGVVKVISSDPTKADGMNISCFVVDEMHENRDRRMYDVLKSSQGMREQPLAIIISTAGFHLDGPYYDMYKLSVEILNDVKQMDNFFPFIWQLDEGDDWSDSNNFIKANPNLDVTVTKDFITQEVNKAKVDPTALNGVLVKNLNMWQQSAMAWISRENVVKCMKDVNIDDYVGYTAYIGVDLSSVNDMTAMSVLIPIGDEKYVLKNYAFLPEETMKDHPNRELYQKFHQDGDMIMTSGNIVDFDYVTKLIYDLSQKLSISGIFYDPYNSGTWSIQCTDLGFNMQPVSQGLLNFNSPTRQFEKWVLGENLIIDKSSLFLWCVGNCSLKEDWNDNRKPIKSSANSKIDCVIAALMATKGYIGNPVANDFNFTSVW